MSRKKVPVKTSHGTQEIKARALGLAPRIRTALLLVDGVRSVAELENLMKSVGVTPGALQLLLDKGLIRFHEEEPEVTVVEALPEAGNSIANPTILIPLPAFVEKAVVEAPAEGAAPVAVATATVLADAAPPTAPGVIEPAVVAPPTAPGIIELAVVAPPPENAPPAREAEPLPKSPSPVDADNQIKPAVEVVTLVELEAILGDATKVEMETILGVATKLEATPTQVADAKSAVTEPSVEKPVLSLRPATQDYWTPGAVKRVIPEAVLRMNLMAARAHLANALDLYLEVGGYALKQKVVASESRAELEQLFLLVESTLRQRIDKPAAALVMDIARELLDR
jgi:hypothetical protein